MHHSFYIRLNLMSYYIRLNLMSLVIMYMHINYLRDRWLVTMKLMFFSNDCTATACLATRRAGFARCRKVCWAINGWNQHKGLQFSTSTLPLFQVILTFAAMKDRTVVGIATISGGQPLDHTDVSNDTKDVGKMEAVNRHRDPRDVGRMEGFGGSESSSTSRLHELK